MQLASKTYLGIILGTKIFFDLNIAFDVPLLLHNVATRCNIVINCILSMANVSKKKNNVTYITLDTPNKLMECLVPMNKIRYYLEHSIGN
jgi:hypothetical protein